MNLIIALACHAWCLGQPTQGGVSFINGGAFATHYRVTYLQRPSVVKLKARIDTELAMIFKLASTWREDSELMRCNPAAMPFGLSCRPLI